MNPSSRPAPTADRGYAGVTRRWGCLRLHAVGFAMPRPSPERAVRSYRTVSPLPPAEAG